MNWSPPPRCGRAAEASLKNAALLQLFHNVLVEIELHLSLLCALNRSNSKTVPNFVGRDITNIAPFQITFEFLPAGFRVPFSASRHPENGLNSRTAPPSRRLGLHNTHTATPFLPVQHPLTALPHP